MEKRQFNFSCSRAAVNSFIDLMSPLIFPSMLPVVSKTATMSTSLPSLWLLVSWPGCIVMIDSPIRTVTELELGGWAGELFLRRMIDMQ